MTVVLAAAVLLGLLGGWILAAVMALVNRRPSSGLVTPSAVKLLSPDAINMAHIKVEGIGGLGLVGAGLLIAIYLPEIGVGLLTGVGFGAAVAVALIIYRSRSSSTRPDGYGGRPPSVLALDDPPARVRPRSRDGLPPARATATA